MNIEQAAVVLGDEYDDCLRDALREVLKSCGAIILEGSWGIGGSQEIETLKVKLGSDILVVESETYMGLSIAGPKDAVENVAQQVNRKLGR